MAKNDDRRRQLMDSAIHVLAEQGSRGLTHRAVDARADAAVGTTANYARTREALLLGILARIEERLTPTDEALAARAHQPRNAATFADYLRDIVMRFRANRDVTLALFELRLEAARRPDIAGPLGAWLRRGFANDVAFNEAAGLPGTAADIALFHYAIEGLMLDQLTTPIDPEADLDVIVATLAERLLSPSVPQERPAMPNDGDAR